MRYLHHDAGTISRVGVGTLGASMLHVFQHLQPLLHELMTLDTLDVHQETDAACIMFMTTVIKSLSIVSCCHI